ncbi:MAG: regulatory protein RecX [Firmicutes bacterium]|nr:regulatory protein RecX [Bacillota bacterium]
MSDCQLKKAREIAYRMLAGKARTEKQVRDRLQQKGIAPEAAEAVIRELLELGYVDDRKFAREYIAWRLEGKPLGPCRMRAALLAAGVERKVADEELAAVFTSGVEDEQADRCLSRLLTGKGRDGRKLLKSLLNRGFSMPAAKRALSRLGIAWQDGDE